MERRRFCTVFARG